MQIRNYSDKVNWFFLFSEYVQTQEKGDSEMSDKRDVMTTDDTERALRECISTVNKLNMF